MTQSANLYEAQKQVQQKEAALKKAEAAANVAREEHQLAVTDLQDMERRLKNPNVIHAENPAVGGYTAKDFPPNG